MTQKSVCTALRLQGEATRSTDKSEKTSIGHGVGVD